MLTLNRDKTESGFFKKWSIKIEQLHYIGNLIEPKTSCRYLGITVDNNLNFDTAKQNVNKSGNCY